MVKDKNRFHEELQKALEVQARETHFLAQDIFRLSESDNITGSNIHDLMEIASEIAHNLENLTRGR